MPATRCPHCALPLLPDEATGAACPACGESLPLAAAPTPQAAPFTSPHQTRRGFASGLAAGALLGLAFASLAAWAGWPAPAGQLKSQPTAGADWVHAPPVKWPSPRMVTDLPRASAEAGDLAKKLAATEEALRDARGRLEVAAEKANLESDKLARMRARAEEAEKMAAALARGLDVEKQKALAAADRPGVKRPDRRRMEGKRSITLDLPNGEYSVPALGNEARITLSGRVRRLKVTSVDGDAVLDAARLLADEVVVLGTINGDSTVKLCAPAGRVSIRDINGKADVRVNAPGGQVTIEELNGVARVSLLAKEVAFANTINGTTETTVTITRDGRLRFKELLGESRLHWMKDKPLDPDPKIERGRINPAAELRRIN